MSQLIQAIIETPKGSIQKYKHDPETDTYKVKKMLPAGMCFPYDFGFIPGTLAEDGDALDILILSESPGFPGCKAEVIVIGGFKAQQSKQGQAPFRNDRIFAVSEASHEFADVKTLKDLPEKLLMQLQYFFIHYNFLENKKFEPLGWFEEEEAMKMIEKLKI